MSKLYDSLFAIANTSSRNEKIALLVREDTPLLRWALEATYNPFRRFNIDSKVSSFTGKGTGQLCVEDDNLLVDLQTRKLSGNKAVEYVGKFIESLDVFDAAIFKCILAKDLRAGISDSTINKAFKGLIPTFDVMLAEKPEKIGKMVYPAYIEPKLDGMRALNVFDGETVEHLSRSGKPIDTLNHTDKELIELLNNIPGIIDTEAMTDSFNSTISAVKRKKATDNLATLHVFDFIPFEDFNKGVCTLTYEQRRKMLAELFAAKDFKFLKLNPSIPVANEEEAKEKFTEFFDAGYEGAIVKSAKGNYEFDRSIHWIKLKPLETGDFEITGFEEGTGKNVGKLGAWIVDYNGVDSRVGGGFSDKQREEFWARRKEMIGDIIEVKYMEGTSNKEGTSRMRHSRFVKVRSMKGSKC